MSESAVSRVIKRIGPDHPITVEPAGHRVTVRLGERIVADTTEALVLREANYPPVFYLPREALDAALVRPSATTSWCPYKGQASYLSLATGDVELPDAAWTYEHPHDDVAQIAGHVAFYPDKVLVSGE